MWFLLLGFKVLFRVFKVIAIVASKIPEQLGFVQTKSLSILVTLSLHLWHTSGSLSSPVLITLAILAL